MPKSREQAADDNAPWRPPKYELADIAAIQAVNLGTANGAQQKRALDWIVKEACKVYDQSYRPGIDGERDTAFAEGKRFVGTQIILLTMLKTGVIARREQ
jgi:hypothetical protein